MYCPRKSKLVSSLSNIYQLSSKFCQFKKVKMCLSSHLDSYIDKRILMCVYVCRKLCMTSIHTECINWIANFSNRNLIFSKYCI